MSLTPLSKMKTKSFEFPGKKVSALFDCSFLDFVNGQHQRSCIILADENCQRHHRSTFKSFSTILIPSGEDKKTQATADYIISELLKREADKKTLLIGVGGGVVTDLTGYVASVYKRGMPFSLVPTTVLAMVDAALGGKNGINVGLLKNMIGTIHQPENIVFDYSFLTSLPQQEWKSGFAEIIKHACIRDEEMFSHLSEHTLQDFIDKPSLLSALIEKNVELKMYIALADEHDQDLRLLLNFGHTIGHALENIHEISHGEAVSIGMIAASRLSQKMNGFPDEQIQRLSGLIQLYGLPLSIASDPNRVFDLIKMDKKRVGRELQFVLLKRIGNGYSMSIPLDVIKENLNELL